MKIFKYKDRVDGHYAFVLAKTELEAYQELKKTTSIIFDMISFKDVSEMDKPIIIINKIQPF